ncbi:hypothetical protein ANCDUO_23701 [Ancylostoma duodenale]|uniref:Uncharacterized protein n=1 Tax=Ancylostoma duodenale TaxID=51022 RepID=A0A0C2FCH9_9BILA|nr:hypothetical protein ANCDUO_23701 [Ancylostoma duodenale]
MVRNHVGIENAPWLCRTTFFAVQIIQNVTCDPVKEYILPIAERLRRMSEKAFREEEHMRTHPDDADEGTVAEDNARLVRDTYAYFPILMKYTDLHRAQWLKAPSWETDGVYENVAVIFRIWSQSQHFKREELNYMAQFEEDAAMVGGEVKTGKAAIAERKKKRREGQMREPKDPKLRVIKKDKHANSIVIACLKRLLPVGLNVFGGRELDIVQQSKERFLQKEPEEKIREFIKGLLEIPIKTDPTDKNAWQLSLYRKIGKSQMRGKNEMTQDAVIEKIFNMGQVSAILHTIMRMKDRLKLRSAFKVVSYSSLSFLLFTVTCKIDGVLHGHWLSHKGESALFHVFLFGIHSLAWFAQTLVRDRGVSRSFLAVLEEYEVDGSALLGLNGSVKFGSANA